MKFEATHPDFQLRVDLELGNHERLAIIGPNGSGKSTLVAQWFQQASGIVRNRARATPPRAALLEQRSLCFPHVSVLENVAFAPRSAGVVPAVARAHAREQLNRAGLGDYADRYPAELSGGQQQRVALLRSLATGASTVLLDEPLTGLDVQVASEYRQLVATSTQDVAHLVVVTHSATDLRELAERVIVLDRGSLVADMTVQQFFSSPPNAFSQLFIGERPAKTGTIEP